MECRAPSLLSGKESGDETPTEPVVVVVQWCHFPELQQTAAEAIQDILSPSLFGGISVLLRSRTLGPLPPCSATSASFCPLRSPPVGFLHRWTASAAAVSPGRDRIPHSCVPAGLSAESCDPLRQVFISSKGWERFLMACPGKPWGHTLNVWWCRKGWVFQAMCCSSSLPGTAGGSVILPADKFPVSLPA